MHCRLILQFNDVHGHVIKTKPTEGGLTYVDMDIFPVYYIHVFTHCNTVHVLM